jgi:hypothetical protein
MDGNERSVPIVHPPARGMRGDTTRNSSALADDHYRKALNLRTPVPPELDVRGDDLPVGILLFCTQEATGRSRAG